MKTVRRPPYPKWNPGYFPCSSLTPPLPLSSRRPSVSFGGFGLSRLLRRSSQVDARPHRRDRRIATLPFRYCPLGDLKGGLRDVPGKAGLAPQVLAEEYSVLVKWKIAFGGLGDAVDGASSKHGSSTDQKRGPEGTEG